jgi:hypothetical protein
MDDAMKMRVPGKIPWPAVTVSVAAASRTVKLICSLGISGRPVRASSPARIRAW